MQPLLITTQYKGMLPSFEKRFFMAYAKDLSGKVFGSWKVLQRYFHEPIRRGNAYWLCECICGDKIPVRSSHLVGKTSKSCGCSMENDLTGQTFNGWTVLKKISKPNRNSWVGGKYLCRCKCGNERELLGGSVSTGASKTCGCWQVKETKDTALQSLFTSHKHNAKRRGIEFFLEKEYFSKLVQSICSYCGKSPTQKFNVKMTQSSVSSRMFLYNGIDRIDSSIGYSEKNTVPCCKHCNYSKHDQSISEWKDHLKMIVNHMEIV